MKVLILTASTGGGHNSAAKSLSELLEKEGIQTHIYDITAKKDGIHSKPSTPYETIIKNFPKLFGIAYFITNNPIIKLLKWFISKQTKALYSKVLEVKPDVIVATHPFGIYLVNRYELKIPYIQLLTDFHAHAMYVSKNINCFITPSDYTSYSIAKKEGITINKTFAYGIPVKEKFYIQKPEEKLTNTVMIMLGSMGFSSNMNQIYELLEKDTERKFIFITASNKALRKYVVKKFKTKLIEGKLEVLGYINNVEDIMKKSDIVITKPGGASISECLAMKKPMILTNAIPGLEMENAKILSVYGAAINATEGSLVNIVDDLYKNSYKMLNLKQGIENISKTHSNEKIVNLIKDIVK